MSEIVKIEDRESGRLASIDENNYLEVSTHIPNTPPLFAPNRYKYFTGLLEADGIITGPSMDVDGSTSPVEFKIESNDNYDIHITSVQLILIDAGIAHNFFGNLAPLNTGWDLKVQDGNDEIFLIEKAKKNGDLLFQSGFNKPYGDGSTAFQYDLWTAGMNAFTVNIPIDYSGGFVIRRKTADKIIAVVNDDLTGMNDFQARAFGYRHYPID